MNLAKNIKQKYTYKDYTTWPENERWELIQGIPFNMSPDLPEFIKKFWELFI